MALLLYPPHNFILCSGVIFIANLVKIQHLLQHLQGRLTHKPRQQHVVLVSLLLTLIKGGKFEASSLPSVLCGIIKTASEAKSQCAAGTACNCTGFSFVSET